MIPIAKNVIVTDEAGNFYEPTYPKRAQGLIKNGRARAIGENKICLTNPGAYDADEPCAPPLTERKGHTMESFMDKTPADSREYLEEIMAALLKTLGEPVYIDPSVPDAGQIHTERGKLVDKLIMLWGQMQNTENAD